MNTRYFTHTRLRERLFPLLTIVYLIAIFGIPSWVVVCLVTTSQNPWLRGLCSIAAPLVYAVLFCVTAGLLSRPHQHAIIPGKFPRQPGHPIYFHRRLYGLCWTSLYYFKPVYHVCLTVPALKRLTFRLFGYRGNMDFTIYPDTWIRDLPLLHFEKGVYVSNKATLGTNIALSNGNILVDAIHLSEGALVGHLTMLAPGVRMERQSEVGVGCAIGMKTRIGEGAKIQGHCGIEHRVSIGKNVILGAKSGIATCSNIPDGMRLANGSLIPPRTDLKPSGEYP